MILHTYNFQRMSLPILQSNQGHTMTVHTYIPNQYLATRTPAPAYPHAMGKNNTHTAFISCG